MIQDIAPYHLRNEYDPQAAPGKGSAILFFRGRAPAAAAGEALAFPTYEMCDPDVSYTYLFSVGDCPFFWAEGEAEPPAGFIFRDLRVLRQRADGESCYPEGAAVFSRQTGMFVLYTALQLVSWYRDNVFCGTCGTRTRRSRTERACVCPACGRRIYPRVIPAVIVGVINGEYLLHTKYERRREVPFYALIAGFTEIGETLEETVAREVMEETGLKVKNIRYYKSQPWGIADDLLAGFYCDLDGDPAITIDRSELSEAVWIRREEIVGQPNDYSLTHHMMMTFRDGKEPQ